MYNRLGIFSIILLISGKCIYDKHKHIETLEEKIVDLNIELLSPT